MKSKAKFKIIMISAMYENGGNTTHRLLDGHPELYVYPFESQPGSKYVNDFLSSMYPLKYRWPIFPNSVSAEEAYELIIDEEGKVRSKTPFVSKFRNADFQMSDKDRKQCFVDFMRGKPMTRGNLVEAFFRATFAAWKNYNRSGKEKAYVGYSPIIGIDSDKIVADYGENGFVLHVIRNPWSAYADTKKRAVPLSLHHYITGWVLCQYYMDLFRVKYPGNCFMVRYEDIIADRKSALADVFKASGISYSRTLAYPSWNGEPLKEVFPWGTIRIPTEEVNLQTANELSKEEKDEIFARTEPWLKRFNYMGIYQRIKSASPRK
jgi:hypothetical protein